MPLHESGEDYLEAILVLHEQKGNVRSIDVAQHLGYSKPSVSRAAEDACRIEHDISPETFACLKRHAGGGES